MLKTTVLMTTALTFVLSFTTHSGPGNSAASTMRSADLQNNVISLGCIIQALISKLYTNTVYIDVNVCLKMSVCSFSICMKSILFFCCIGGYDGVIWKVYAQLLSEAIDSWSKRFISVL